jgi:ribose transport system ATP-binding protein
VTAPTIRRDEHLQKESVPFLHVHRLTKTFGGQRALDGASLRLNAGEVHALLGQNGSGKSTLIKILAGVYTPDPGFRIEIEGAELDPSPRAIRHAHFRFVHQDLGLIGSLSAAENLEINASRPRFWLSERALHRRASQVLCEHGVELDVTRPVQELSRAQQSLIAIVRAIADLPPGRGLLVLDEPTASLPPAEVSHLLDALRSLRAKGLAILYVTHRMEEVFDVSERITIFRDGRTVMESRTDSTDNACVTAAILGAQEHARLVDKPPRPRQSGDPADAVSANGSPALSVRGLHGGRVNDVSFELARGEILGLTGLVGSGYDEALSCAFGKTSRQAGEVDVAGTTLNGDHCRAAVQAGIGYVPSDRDRLATLPDWTLAENLTLAQIPSRGLALDRRLERQSTLEWLRRLEVVPRDPNRKIIELSGGNRQRVVLGRWLRRGCRVLLLDEPTIGVDVAGKDRIYSLLRDAADRGVGIVVASSDHTELLEICDRIIVFRDGKIAATLDPTAGITTEQLFRECTGLPADSVHDGDQAGDSTPRRRR